MTNIPALSVLINGVPIATVCTDGYDVLSARASGTHVDDELATLDISGGSYPSGAESNHLIWVNEIPLRSGQLVTVLFLESAPSSHAGKTIEEAFPDEPPVTQTDFTLTPQLFAEVRARPMLRDGFSFRVRSSSGTTFVGKTAPDEHGFGFTVLWNSSSPERARVSLHSYTLDSLEVHGPMNYKFDERLQYGDSVRFELVD